MQIKICGITSQSEIEVLNELKSDYAGFVLFYEKSKRNIELQRAVNLKNLLSHSKSVAVTVSPDFEQSSSIEVAGFDILQRLWMITEYQELFWMERQPGAVNSLVGKCLTIFMINIFKVIISCLYWQAD